MTIYLRLILILVGIIVVGGCDAASTSLPTESGVNVLVATEGTVRLKREGWNDYQPVAAGMVLQPSDLLEVTGRAQVVCAGPTVTIITDLRAPCPSARGWLDYQEAQFVSRQRGASNDIPYVLYPRNTVILDPHPRLRWHDTGTSRYTVAIVAGTQTVWSQTGITGTELVYPTNAPALQPETDYLLIVTDAMTGHTSEADPAKGLGFRVLDTGQRETVINQQNALLALTELDAPAQNLALAVSYMSFFAPGERGLSGDALLLLEEEVVPYRTTPAVQRLMGDLFWQMKLPHEAQAAYENARQQAETLGDQATQAAALAGLWRVTGDSAYLDAAIEGYEELGEQRTADALKAERTQTP